MPTEQTARRMDDAVNDSVGSSLSLSFSPLDLEYSPSSPTAHE